MAWFISPPLIQQNSGIIDFYLGRRTVIVQTTQTDTGHAFVQRLTNNFAYDSAVQGSIVHVPLNGTVLIDLSSYPAGYYRVVAGASFTFANYLTQTGTGNICTPPLPVIYRTYVTDAYTLLPSPQLTVSFPVFPQLQFNWNIQEEGNTLKAEWRKDGEHGFSSMDQLTGNSYIASPFEYGASYELRLSVKSSLTGEYSAPSIAFIIYPHDTLLTPIVIAAPFLSSISLEWAPVPFASRYLIRYKLHDSVGGWISHTTTDTQIILRNLDAFVQYDIQVIAQADNYIDSSPHTLLLSTFGPIPAISPILEKQYPKINIGHWDAHVLSTLDVFYEVRFNLTEDFMSSMAMNTSSVPSFIHHVQAPELTYYYWIRPVVSFAGTTTFGEWASGLILGSLETYSPMSYRIHLDITDYPENSSEIPFFVEVDWGDGSISQYADLTSMPEFTHDYSTAGTYFVTFSLTNYCGTTHTRSEVTLNAKYEETPSNTPLGTKALTIFNISSSDTTDDNIPPIEITGEVHEFLLESGKYGYETVITSNLELIRFPVVYELIPANKLVLGNDSNSNMTDFCTEHLEYSVAISAPPDSHATLFADMAFSLVFNYIELLSPTQLYFNTFDVSICADATFFTRCSCLGFPAIDPVDNEDGTFTGILQFNGKHIAGFQLEIANGPLAKLHQVVINILQKDGSISRISNNVLDVYAVSFITNKQSLLDINTKTHSTVSGTSYGYIPIISTSNIDLIEISCDAAIKERIVYDTFRIVDNRYLLTVRNTGTNPQEIHIPITTGKSGQIFYVQAFTATPPDLTNLPLIFQPDINARRTHHTYFYRISTDQHTLISQDLFVSPVFPFAGTGTLQTLYGPVTFSFLG